MYSYNKQSLLDNCFFFHITEDMFAQTFPGYGDAHLLVESLSGIDDEYKCLRMLSNSYNYQSEVQIPTYKTSEVFRARVNYFGLDDDMQECRPNLGS